MSKATSSHRSEPDARPRRGQALAEFALTLPILLLLVFGIVEFARLFQTWVVLQSAARAGARAASIGFINYEIFNVTPDARPIDLRVLDAVVPCDELDQRGAIVTDPSGVKFYNGAEGFFATMYDGTDCDPTNEDHLQLRKDILRVFSVISEVRETSSTIAVYEDRVDQDYNSISPSQAFDFVKGYWNRPYKSADNAGSPGWISVEMCSTRPLMDGSPASSVETRFATIRNAADESAAGGANGYPRPFCKLNEIPAPDGSGTPRPDALDNHGYRWFDVGGPGDRVTVFIKFNHPLITPLNLASYVALESRRSSVNESFRAPKAVGAFQRSIPPGRDDEDPLDPTWTPSTTPIPSATFTATETFTLTPSETPPEFSCANIHVIWSPSPFSGTKLFMTIQNENVEATDLMRVRLGWNSSSSWPLMYAQAFELESSVHWQGGPPASPPQDLVDTRTDGAFYDGDPVGEPASFRTIGGLNNAVWAAQYINGPSTLSSAFTLNDFDAEFEFSNPAGSPCIIQLTRPFIPSATPSEVPTEGTPPSQTPVVCEPLSNIILQPSVFFDPFDGSARMTLTNIGDQTAYVVGFRLVWPDPTHEDVDEQPGRYFLRRVLVGGSGTTDPSAVQVWTSSAPGQDATGNTNTELPFTVSTVSHGADGTWHIDAILLPGDTYIWLDFDGFPGRLSNLGVIPAHFNSSQYFIGRPEGCGEGAGEGPEPTIILQATLPSPTTTNTKKPSPTTAPTLTASNTVPTVPPTITNTFVPTLTPTETPTFTTPTRTQVGGLTPTEGAGGD